MEKSEKIIDKRTRSPNYPALSLKAALEKIAILYKNQHTHAAPREVVVKSMGYNGLNGASATAVSAVMKYGLLDRIGQDLKISDRSMCILHPQSSEEKANALRDAAMEPQLFRELAEKFPGRLPADELLRNHLIRNGFSPSAVSSVVLSYRETFEFIDQEVGEYNVDVMSSKGDGVALSTLSNINIKSALNNHIIEQIERILVSYHFESGATIKISMTGDIPTAKAIGMAETLLKLKKQELIDMPEGRTKEFSMEEL